MRNLSYSALKDNDARMNSERHSAANDEMTHILASLSTSLMYCLSMTWRTKGPIGRLTIDGHRDASGSSCADPNPVSRTDSSPHGSDGTLLQRISFHWLFVDVDGIMEKVVSVPRTLSLFLVEVLPVLTHWAARTCQPSTSPRGVDCAYQPFWR